VIGARRQIQLRHRLPEQGPRRIRQHAVNIDVGGFQRLVGAALSSVLPLSSLHHPLAHQRARFPEACTEFMFGERRDGHHQIDSIQQGAGQPAAIARDLIGRAAASRRRMAEITAGAGVHRRHQLEARRKSGPPRRARNGDVAGFQRLAQRLEHAAVEFRQFVEKQHTVVRQRDFTGLRHRSAPHQSGRAG
jgi:hypothetical protein